jgi:hypothetical protein
MKKVFFAFISCLLMTSLAKAQIEKRGIQDYLDSYAGENAVPYVQPLADILTSNINTGIWDWSAIPDEFYLRLKLQGMMSFPDESMRTFTGRTTGDFRPEQSMTVPTIIGDQNATVLQGDNNQVYVFPGGYDLEQITLGTPQVTIGGFLNSEVSGRFLSFRLSDDVGRVHFYGLGARHSLTGYFDNPPIDLSVGYFYHHIEAGSYLDSDQHLVSAMVGKSGKIFSGHLGLGYQTSMSDVHYTFDDGDQQLNVDLDLENNNPWIVEAGLGLKLGPLFASTAVSYARHPTVSAGVGLSF